MVRYIPKFILCIFTFLVYSCEKSPELIQENVSSHYLTDYANEWDFKFGTQSYKHAKKIVSYGPRPVQSVELEQVRRYVEKEFEQVGWVVKRQAFVTDTPKGKKQFVNLLVRYKGPGETLEQVWKKRHRGVVGAHIDSKKIKGINYLGAVDAAGAIGMLIECADYLAKYAPEIASQIEIVCFDGEEAILEDITYGSGTSVPDGLYGSHYYALNRNRKRKFGLVLDLLGHKKQRVKIPGDTPRHLAKKFNEVIIHHQLEAEFSIAKSGGIIDDHVPLNIYGTPSMDLIGEFSSKDTWWHKAGDTAEVLSEEKLGLSMKVALDLIGSFSK